MRVHGYRRTWEVADLPSLADVLSWRDECGGAMLWLTTTDVQYPVAADVGGGVVVRAVAQQGHAQSGDAADGGVLCRNT